MGACPWGIGPWSRHLLITNVFSLSNWDLWCFVKAAWCHNHLQSGTFLQYKWHKLNPMSFFYHKKIICILESFPYGCVNAWICERPQIPMSLSPDAWLLIHKAGDDVITEKLGWMMSFSNQVIVRNRLMTVIVFWWQYSVQHWSS